jgi:Domain of unknown function (DUF1707)
VGLVGARDRELAAVALRRHYVNGRLSLAELEERLQLAVRARTRRELRAAALGLPPSWLDVDELRRRGVRARRAAHRAAITVVWIFLTFVLLIAFGASTLEHGVDSVPTFAVTAVWLAVTLLAWRARRRA